MTETKITVLRYPEAVRIRKEMYLIDPNHCIYEIIDNSVDEHSAGRCSKISMTVKENDSPFQTVIIKDNGAGIPVSSSSDPEHKGESQMIVAMTTLHAGGKFSAQEGSYTTVTSGLHGVGASCVNAVSESFTVTSHNGLLYGKADFEKGILKNSDFHQLKSDKDNGTTVEFILDSELWKNESYNFEIIKRRLEQLSYLNPGLTITYEYYDKDNNQVEYFEYIAKEGLSDYFKMMNKSKSLLDSSPIAINKLIEDKNLGNIQISAIFNYSVGYSSEVYGFVNNVSTQSGDHYTGFNTGISKAIMDFLKTNDKHKNLLKNLTNEDCREGLLAIISVKVMEPKFEGQGKNSIKMPEIRSYMNQIIADEFHLYLEQHPNFVKLLLDKLDKAVKARIAAKRAREAIRNAKGALDASLPGKLKACSSKKPQESELFLVEGDSAAGSASQGRDSRTQAILPVFGKILNTEKTREDEVLKNTKLLDVIKALKCGIGKTFDISKLRYHKVIIMADADK